MTCVFYAEQYPGQWGRLTQCEQCGEASRYVSSDYGYRVCKSCKEQYDKVLRLEEIGHYAYDQG